MIKYLFAQSYVVSSIPIYYKKFSNRFICSVDGTLTDTTALGQSGPENNDNEEVLHTPQSS